MIPDNEYIIGRFFEAVDTLIKKDVYASYYQFAQVHNFDRSQLMKSKLDHASRRFEIAWITPLITKHHIDTEWLFTGKGKPFDAKILQNTMQHF